MKRQQSRQVVLGDRQGCSLSQDRAQESRWEQSPWVWHDLGPGAFLLALLGGQLG